MRRMRGRGKMRISRRREKGKVMMMRDERAREDIRERT